ncbi:MAG: THUMP domain-containing protein, partial [Candidatus Methanosuratincola petrocarbonis]
MGAVLVTVECDKEERATIEILDSILPLDVGASIRRCESRGILILETSLDPDQAAESIAGSLTRLVRSTVPVDLLVSSDLSEIEQALVPRIEAGSKIAVRCRCRRRGSSLPPPLEVERLVGRSLVELGCTVDLESPDQIVRIEIIGETTAVS